MFVYIKKGIVLDPIDFQCMDQNHSKYTILPKVLGRPLLMNRFDYFSHFYEYKS